MSSVVGNIAGTRVNGDIDLSSGSNRLRLNGALELDHMSLPVLASLLVGPSAQPAAGTLWSGSAFAPGLPELPDVAVSLKAERLELMSGIEARQANLRLALDRGTFNVTDLAGSIGPGRVAGRLALRRDGPTVSLSGTASMSGLSLPGTWGDGLLGGHVEFSSTGTTPAALVAGLAGNGAVQLRDLVVAHADPRAPDRVIADAEAGNIYLSENDFLGALRRELDKAPLAVARKEFDLQIAGGSARMTSQDMSAVLDLRRLGFELRATLPAQNLPSDWNGPPPHVTLVWHGPLSATQRDLDAGAFVNVLASRALVREAARIEALEADFRERAFFARRQRGFEFLRRRETELAIFEQERARLAEVERQKALALRLERERRALEMQDGGDAGVPSTLSSPPPEFRAPSAGTDPSQAGRY